ncbi:MAG TPA: 7-cyano-7-deazaguanine synthase, partial [Nitrososphaerales archaeon]|nr:7-cyano-7-deazaguanine synthase [Nitrososphaerales archaeon]
LRLNVPLELTWSCEKQEDVPCKSCRSCKLRIDSFSGLGIQDPLTK